MIWAIIGTMLTVCVAGLAVLRRRYVSVLIEGTSMEPTLHAGQRVLVRRTCAQRLRRGQVVVLANPTDTPPEAGTPPGTGNPPWLIKRILAVPGEPVPRETVQALRHVTERRVPAGRLVLLGDNQAASYDSRRAGYFPTDTLLGIVVRTLHA